MANELRDFLELSYDELEELNLESKGLRKNIFAHLRLTIPVELSPFE